MQEAAQSLYSSHIKDLDLRTIKESCPGIWNSLEEMLDTQDYFTNWAYAYMTSGPTSSQDETYQEMGALMPPLH